MKRTQPHSGSSTVSDVRAALNAEAEAVMNSRPTPSQAELDAIISGTAHLDDKVDPDNPEMPPLGAQQAALEAAKPDLAPVPPEGGSVSAPVNVDVPHVTGVGEVGQTLNCTMGNWQGEPTEYAYAWATDGEPNSAVGDTYSVVPGDAGKNITCVVTATNGIGATEAPSSNAVVIAAGDTGVQTRMVPRATPSPKS